MYLPIEKAEMVLRMLLEGNSVSSVERTDRRSPRHDSETPGARWREVRADHGRKDPQRRSAGRGMRRTLGFIGKKQKRVRPEDDQNLGDCYTFVAIERHSKLVLNIAMGKRDQATTDIFIEGLRHATARKRSRSRLMDSRLTKRPSLTRWATACDFAMLIKVYRAASEGEGRYSPAEVAVRGGSPSHGATRPEPHLHFDRRTVQSQPAHGNPPIHPADECLSEEVGEPLGRCVRLVHLLQLLPRPQILRVTPAMAAGIADHVWSVRELLEAA